MSGFYDDEASPWATQAEDSLSASFDPINTESSPWGDPSEPNSPIAASPPLESSIYDPYSFGSVPLVADDNENVDSINYNEEPNHETANSVENTPPTESAAIPSSALSSNSEPVPALKPSRNKSKKKSRGNLAVESVDSDPLAASTVQLSDVSLSKPGVPASAPSSASSNTGYNPSNGFESQLPAPPPTAAAQFGVPQPLSRPTVPAKFEISVGDPATVGELANAHTEYTVQLTTDCPAYEVQETAVQRRYRDFRSLYRTLEHTHPGVVVPAVPDKQALGRFNDDFVQQRRAGLETMLRKMVAHPLLYQDPDLIAFLTSTDFAEYLRTRMNGDEALKRANQSTFLDSSERHSGNSHSGGSSTGSGFIGSLSGALSLSRGTDADPWTVQKRKQLDEVETHLRAVQRDLVAISISRQHLSDSMGELSSVLKVLSEIEATQRLSSVLKAFSRVHDRLAAIYTRQRQQNLLTLEATLDEHTRTIGSIRDAINARQQIFSEAEQMNTEYEKQQAALDKFRRQGRVQSDREGALVEDTEKAAQKAEQLQKRARDVAHLVESEIARVNEEKVVEFRNAVEIYLETTVEAQKEAIEVWETFYSRHFAS